MVDVREGRGNDTLFPQYVTDAFVNAIYPVGSTEVIVTPPVTPPGQIVQPKVLLEEWRADAPGTVDLDYSLGVPVVTKWRGTINGYELSPYALTTAPFWVSTTNTTSGHPAVSFDGVDDWLECLTMANKLNNLTGLTVSMRVNPMDPPVNTLARMVWLESGVAGVPRFGYARSGIGSSDFYADGAARDTDPVIPLTGGTYDYEGWATHTVRRDYLLGTNRVDYNGGLKTQGSGIQTINYGASTEPLRFRLGAQDQGANPGAFYLYGLRLYTYYITDNDMLTDATYYGGFA